MEKTAPARLLKTTKTAQGMLSETHIDNVTANPRRHLKTLARSASFGIHDGSSALTILPYEHSETLQGHACKPHCSSMTWLTKNGLPGTKSMCYGP